MLLLFQADAGMRDAQESRGVGVEYTRRSEERRVEDVGNTAGVAHKEEDAMLWVNEKGKCRRGIWR